MTDVIPPRQASILLPTLVRSSRDLRQDFSRPTSGVIRKGFVPVARLCFSHFNGEQPRSLEKGRPPDLLEVRNNHVRSHRIPVCSTRISSFSGKFFFSTCFRSSPFCQDTAMCLNRFNNNQQTACFSSQNPIGGTP